MYDKYGMYGLHGMSVLLGSVLNVIHGNIRNVWYACIYAYGGALRIYNDISINPTAIAAVELGARRLHCSVG